MPKAPAPPGAAQRKYIFGLGGPQGPRCHMSLYKGPPGPYKANDGKANRIQGIRTLPQGESYYN